jgi:hypothetical protein
MIEVYFVTVIVMFTLMFDRVIYHDKSTTTRNIVTPSFAFRNMCIYDATTHTSS